MAAHLGTVMWRAICCYKPVQSHDFRDSVQPAVLNHFRLRENPFGVTPDPKFLFFSQTHREALASLINGVDWGFGFQVLVAQPGMGKTTLLLNLLSRFQDKAHTAFLFQPQISPTELLQSLLSELGVNSQATSIRTLCEDLNLFLLGAANANKRVVIILDEAQNLDFTSLEMLRQLSNFETSDSKLMNVILAGQPQLLKNLSAPEQQQLQQRISAIGRLSPLSVDDTSLYIVHRLNTAGQGGQTLFPASVIHDIWQNSQGIPRNINRLCLNAMLLAFTERVKQISNSILREAIRDLDPNYVFSQMQLGDQRTTAVATRETLVLPRTPAPPVSAPSTTLHIEEGSIAASKSSIPLVVGAVEDAVSGANLEFASKEKPFQPMRENTKVVTSTRALQTNKSAPVRPNAPRALPQNRSGGLASASKRAKQRSFSRLWFNALLTMVVMAVLLWLVIERAASNSWPQPQRAGPGQSLSSSSAVSNSDPQDSNGAVAPAPIVTIYFEEDSAIIASQSRGTLDAVPDMLASNPELDLVLEGHTDDSGPEAYNLDLSNRRSLAVRDALTKDLHVSPERLKVAGLGSAQPLQSNATASGRAYNRRVEIRVVERRPNS
jgi:type II secretory pathway predicted ATPase ExeA/outer membrane protein OmpA-like peptidoglycan-associated protein